MNTMLDKIQEYLSSTKNELVEATAVKTGALHTEVTLKVKDFSNISKIDKSLEGLPFFVLCQSPIILPCPENGTYRLIIPNKEVKQVKFEVSHLIRPTNIFLGLDEDAKPLIMDLSRMTHAIIAGATGSGKSMVIHAIIHSLLHYEGVDIVFIDPKKVESQMYTGTAAVKVASSPAAISEELSRIHSWMEHRYNYMARNCIRDAMERWVATGYKDDNLKPMVLIVDEVADLFSDNKSARSELLVLSSKARAAGLRIFLATQRPDAKIIDGAIKANFTTRICLKTSSRIDSTIVLGFGGAENLRGSGHGLLLNSRGDLVPFKGAFLDPIRLARYAGVFGDTERQKYEVVTDDIKEFIKRCSKISKE